MKNYVPSIRYNERRNLQQDQLLLVMWGERPIQISWWPKQSKLNIVIFWQLNVSCMECSSSDNSELHLEDYHWKWCLSVINSINGDIYIPKKIINLLEDIEFYILPLDSLNLSVVIGLSNMDANRLVKKAHNQICLALRNLLFVVINNVLLLDKTKWTE